ncbi:ATP-binding protein [Parapedobacter sp. 2B3]|uniref:ATP-binding protein n=1 Tax=Parapedobacter sp. 2B3 TaxID=3342381 RepID=UPI0035B60A3F
MSVNTIKIELEKIDNHWALVSLFDGVHELQTHDTVNLILDFSAQNLFVHADHLLVIVSMVHHLRHRGVTVGIQVVGQNDYASRVNFFRLLDVPYEESFVRRKASGKFIELFRFDNNLIYRLQDDLTMIIHQLGNVALEVKQLMFYCLNEIMDNVLVHSGQDFGWVAAQVFPSRREIRLIICDNGVGVLESLQSSGLKEFLNITERQALEMSIQRGITSGKGLGFGLYATSQFITQNRGEMLLYSGNHCLELDRSGIVIHDGATWPGTVVALRIRTDIVVDYKTIMPPNHTLPDDYQLIIDKYFGEDNELW